MADEAHQRLLAELDADRFDTPEVITAIDQIGPRGYLLRGLARARRNAWASVRADMIAARSEPVGALTDYIGGTALVVARDYDAGMALLQRAASCSVPAVSSYSSKLFAKFARELGWIEESLVMLDAIAAARPAADLEGRTQELRRRSASHQRESDALLGSPTEAAAKVWGRLFVDGVAAATSSADALLERRGEQLDVLATRIRLDLLLGDLERAGSWLAALSSDSLVAERAALALALGRLDDVLALTEKAQADAPRLLHLRGEALLSAERFSEAATTLERARVVMPHSLALALALALARHFEDPHTPGIEFEHRFADLLEHAPALLADAAGELGITLWTDEGPIRSRSDAARIAVQARAMLTDERDSLHSHYQRPGRPLRQVLMPWPPHLGRPSHLARLHESDRRWIDQIQSTLVSAIGVDPRGPAAPKSVEVAKSLAWKPCFLSAEQIEQFLADGFLTIPRAFDPELARRWREDANRRIREEPHKWVRGYDPNDEAKSLRKYSPTDPTTWTWPRLVLEGNEEFAAEEFAPQAWAAICDLLGGPERIKTRIWNNYVNLNFNADAHLEGAELGTGRPGPDWNSWHIDDPHPAMRIDRVRNGLICIALFDRVLPASGSTWLCLDSVSRIARELAEHPEGVDFVHDRGARFTRLCSRFHEVVGETGDMVLMHPLMLHSGSPNPSGRIRWMGNPMVYMKQPLDPMRANLDELSPVELMMRRAIS